jgi:hypothetical protein
MPDGAAVWTIKLEGNIQGDWVNELRRAWRAVRLAANGASIRLVLVDVQLIDTAGKVLLAEMDRDGVAILPTAAATGYQVVQLRRAVALDPDDPHVRLMLANVLRGVGERE